MSVAPRYCPSAIAAIRLTRRLTTGLAVLFSAAIPACNGSPDTSARSAMGATMDAASLESQDAAAPAETRGPSPVTNRSDHGASLGMIGSTTAQSHEIAAPPPLGSAAAPSAIVMIKAVTAQATPAMVIRSGHASVEVDTLPRAIASIQRVTTSLGGYVGNTAIVLGEDQVRRATIELKIPVTRYDEAVAGLTPLGKVESVNSSAEDVGEEFTDLTARIENAHRLETRLIALLAERTGKLQDALIVERELARVREEIERYAGRIRFLSSRIAMSTLTVSLHEPIPLVSHNPSENVLAAAAKDAWRNFVRLLALAIESLGVVLPIGALGAAAYAVYRRRTTANSGTVGSVTGRS